MGTKKGISIIICTYNGASLLPETLKHIAMQEVSTETRYELIIVDNNSNDNTNEVALLMKEKYEFSCPFRILFEPEKGKSEALKHGIDNAKFEYILICDDDNWLSKRYVETAFSKINSDCNIGIVGGYGVPVFEKEPDDEIRNFLGYMAIGKPLVQSGFIDEPSGVVYGAGMVIRKTIFDILKSKQLVPLVTARRGRKLLGGEDLEHCYIARLLGYKIWFEDKMAFKHYFPAYRTNWNYLKKLFKSFGNAYPVLRIYKFVLAEHIQSEIDMPKLWRLRLISTLIRHLIKFKSGFFYLLIRNDFGRESVLRFLLIFHQLKNCVIDFRKIKKNLNYILLMRDKFKNYSIKNLSCQ